MKPLLVEHSSDVLFLSTTRIALPGGRQLALIYEVKLHFGLSFGPFRTSSSYLCSKSTGAVTSCTRKYLASAGYFRATASYIA
jgi:hypothetical protein